MTFQESVKTVLTEKYATFRGRASRSEFWWFMLAYVLGTILVALTFIYALQAIYWLAMILPMAAVGFRRMQDTGRPGWYFFIPTIYWFLTSLFFPTADIDPATGTLTEMPDAGSVATGAFFSVVGFIISLVFLWWLTRPSETGENAYGPQPTT